MEKTKKTDKFLLRIDKDLKEKVFRRACEDNRSINSHIVHVLQNDVKENEKRDI